VAECIRIGRQIESITAVNGGKIAEGLEHGNSPFEYPGNLLKGKHWYLLPPMEPSCFIWRWIKCEGIITGSFPNLPQYVIIYWHKIKM